MRGSQFLFLDEALSSLDEENRRHIYRHVVLGERYRNVTMVMVSHDLSLIDYCDTAWFMMDRETFEKIPGGGARAGWVVPDAGHSPASPKGTGGPAPQPHGRHALLAEPTLIPPTPTHRQRPSSG